MPGAVVHGRPRASAGAARARRAVAGRRGRLPVRARGGACCWCPRSRWRRSRAWRSPPQRAAGADRAPRRRAAGALARAAVRRRRDRLDAPGVRARRRQRAAAPRRRQAVGRRHRGEPAHARQRPAVGRRACCAPTIERAPVDRALLQLPEHDGRPVHGRRRSDADDGRRAPARPRRLDQDARSWANDRFAYTHGYGVVAVRAATSTPPDTRVRAEATSLAAEPARPAPAPHLLRRAARSRPAVRGRSQPAAARSTSPYRARRARVPLRRDRRRSRSRARCGGPRSPPASATSSCC